MRAQGNRRARLAMLGVLVSCAAASAAPPASKKTNAVLPGGNSKQPIDIEAVKLDYFDKEQKLIYTGNVIATQGDSKLKSTVLTIYLAPKNPDAPSTASTNQVQRMVAVGPVTLLQRDQVGTGDSGVYEKASNTVVLTGNVTLTQGPNITKGDKLVYDLKSGQAVVTGRVKSMFIPADNEATTAADDPATHRASRKSTAVSSPAPHGM